MSDNLLASLPPGLLKDYHIVDKLGHGGMAQVYLAQDQRLDRQVALKVISIDQ